MRFLVAAATATALTAVALAKPDEPAAQPECAPGFGVVRPDPVSVETVTQIEAHAAEAERVEVDWGDGARSVEPLRGRRSVVAYHRFTRAGPVEVVVTPVCGETRGRSVRLQLEVLVPCAQRRDRSVSASDCDDARASLIIADIGGQASADWVDVPCRDGMTMDVVRPPGDVPTARQADCALPRVGSLVGPLYARRGGSIRLTFGAPARRVVLRRGTRTRSVSRLGDARPVNRSGRAWRFRLPPRSSRRLRRLYIVAFRPDQTDHYVIDLR